MRRHALLLGFGVVAVLAVATSPAAAGDYDNATIDRYHTDAALDSTAEVQLAVENGTASSGEYVATNASLVVAIDSGRLAADIDAGDGTATERFFAVLDGDPGLLVHQLDYGQEREPKVFDLGPANTTVYRAGNTTYVVIDTASVTLSYEPRPPAFPEDIGYEVGEAYAVDIAESPANTRETETAFEFVDAPSKFVGNPSDGEGTPPGVLPTEVVTVTVRPYLEAKGTHEVRMRLEDGRVLTTAVAETTAALGTDQRVEFDLRGVASGTNYTLELVHDGRIVDRRNGTVQRPTARLSEPRVGTVSGDRYLNLTARLPWGGEVVVTTADGEQRAAVALLPDRQRNLSIAFRGRNGRVQVPEDGRVRALRTNGEPYQDAEHRLGRTGLPLSTPTATPTARATPTPPPTVTPTSAAASPADAEELPGFGILSAMAALLALLALARRRTLAG